MKNQKLMKILLAVLIVSVSSCKKDNTPGASSSGQSEPVVTGSKPVKMMTNSLGMKMLWISPGEFMMGAPATEKGSDNDERPVHRVVITQGFWMGQYEVTQDQYQKVIGINPSKFKGAGVLPVEMTSWNDAAKFCKKLSQKEGKTYRLPTEAEWEYACRAGGTTPYCFGDDAGRLNEYAWHSGNSGNETHPVGQKKSNPWGFYDMHGNAWEWCSDWYGSYSEAIQTDPNGPSSGEYRILRGGSWDYLPVLCRSASRGADSSALRYNTLGFRVVLDF